MVCTFVERYPKLLSFSDQELDQVQHVHEEFLGHQALFREDTSDCLHGMALFAMKLVKTDRIINLPRVTIRQSNVG